MTNEQITAVVERFFVAVTRRTNRYDLRDATRDLLEALTATGQVTITQVTGLLMERLDRLERRQEILQRHIEAIDVRLDELGQERGAEE